MSIHHCIGIILALLLAGCASVAPLSAPSDTPFHDAGFGPPSEATDGASLFDLSPAMKAYLASPAFAARVRANGVQRGLVEALYGSGELKVDYDASYTRTAAQAFAEKSGNCLSLVIMTAALARALEVEVIYQHVQVQENWSRSGNLQVGSTHVNLSLGRSQRYDALRGGFEPDRRYLTIDFVPSAVAARLHSTPLDEAEVVAMFMNNRAAESMEQGRIDDAYWWAVSAVKAAPLWANAYNTLGVIYRRHGDQALAERAFKAALQREPENTAVMHNLVPVLADLGKEDESRALAARVASIEPYPPFYYFDQGQAAMEKGDFDGARRMFAREVRRAPYNHEFHFWLGLAQLYLGDGRGAREQVALALENSTTREASRAYSAKLELLRASLPERHN